MGTTRVASRANVLYLAARTHNCAVACLHEAHIACLREFWTEVSWLYTVPRKQVLTKERRPDPTGRRGGGRRPALERGERAECWVFCVLGLLEESRYSKILNKYRVAYFKIQSSSSEENYIARGREKENTHTHTHEGSQETERLNLNTGREGFVRIPACRRNAGVQSRAILLLSFRVPTYKRTVSRRLPCICARFSAWMSVNETLLARDPPRHMVVAERMISDAPCWATMNRKAAGWAAAENPGPALPCRLQSALPP